MTGRLFAEQVVTGPDSFVVQVTLDLGAGHTRTVALTPQQAEVASNDLWNASCTPAECKFCGQLSSTTIAGNEPACNRCAAAFDSVSEPVPA
jgi:hypothetical protein